MLGPSGMDFLYDERWRRRPLRAAAVRLREDLRPLVIVQAAEAVDLEAVFLQ
jgi:hypothetical protein